MDVTQSFADEGVDHLGTLLRRYERGEDTLRCTVCPPPRPPATAGPAVKYCSVCYELFCATCSSKHERHTTFKDHALADVSPETMEGLRCSDHANRFVQRYCLDCDRSICMVCTHSAHRLHKTGTLVTATSTDLIQRKAICKFLESSLESIEDTKIRIERFRDDSRKALEEARRMINQRVWEIMMSIHEQQQSLYEEVDAFYDRLKEQCGQLQRQAEISSDQLRPVYESALAAMTPLPGNSHVTTAVFPLERYQQAFTEITTLNRHLDLQPPSNIYRAGLGQNLGSVQVPNIKLITPRVDLEKDVDIMKPVKILWKEESFSEQTVDLCCAFGNNSDVVLHTQLHEDTFHVGMLDLQGKTINPPTHLQTTSKQFCTVGSNISCTNSVILTNSYDLCWNIAVVQRPGYEVTLETIGVHPSGQPVAIAISLAGNYIVTTMSDPDNGQGQTSLRCYRPDGSLQWCQDTNGSSASGGLLTPWSLCVDPLDRILVADLDGHCVQVYDHEGKHLHTIQAGSTDTDDWSPSSIAVDAAGALYVTSYKRCLVSMFTPTGQLVKHLVRTESGPKMVSVCDGKLVVATDTGIQMYQLQSE